MRIRTRQVIVKDVMLLLALAHVMKWILALKAMYAVQMGVPVAWTRDAVGYLITENLAFTLAHQMTIVLKKTT